MRPRARAYSIPRDARASSIARDQESDDDQFPAVAPGLRTGGPRRRHLAATVRRGVRRNRARVLRGPGARAARPVADAGAVRRIRAPAGPTAAARDRPVSPSGGPQHPDPVQRQEGRQADGPAGRGIVLPHGLLVPAGPGARDDAPFDRRAEAGRQYAVRQPAGGVRRPARRDEAADRAALRHPPLRQPARHRTSAAARPPRPSPRSRRPRCRSSRTRSRARTR